MSGRTPHASDDPHADGELVTAGAPVEEAAAAVVLVHGRGATARSIVGFGEEVAGDAADALGGTPAFVGCSDVDPHIPEERVHETTAVLEALGADVDERIYEGMGHGINEDERAAVAAPVASLS